MQYGYFDDDNREYVITRPDTPRPWSNYLGSLDYGAIITNHAGGYSFYRSALTSRFLRIRPNSVPMDQPGRQFYLRDNENGDYWSAAWQPVGKSLEEYESECRHGTAYTTITSKYRQIETRSTYFVPLGQNFEYWVLEVKNSSDKPRTLGVFTYCEMATSWHMFNDLTNLQYAQFISCARVVDEMLGVAVEPYIPFDSGNLMDCKRLWMCMNGAPLTSFETVRERFLGSVYHTYAAPQAVVNGKCSGFLAEGENPCGALHSDIELKPGQSRTLVVMLGLGSPESHGFASREKFGSPEVAAQELKKLKSYWHEKLDGINVRTPESNFNSMVNTWGAYNSLITYAWSRHASLIYNGERDGLGFRDTVQDFLGAMPLLKGEIRPRLELMLTGQFSSGGALPVVKPFEHNPGKMPPLSPDEYRSDDCLWFFNSVPDYVAETGDVDFYDTYLPYADEGGDTVFGHLKKAILFNLNRSGANGLPCGLKADWNDCVQMGYNGESVMVAFQLSYALGIYADIAKRLDKADEAAWALKERRRLDAAIQKAAWDGKWFLWAIGEDGHRYGSDDAEEGKIYINTQVWAVISGSATIEQGRSAMEHLNRMCATPYGIMLSAPPFTRTPKTVMGGVIYNHGIKENAGIFCHTQGWAVMAEAILGNGDQAWEYYKAYMPSAYNEHAEVRECEPYVHCQTTYATCNRNAGKSRVPWLSGTASWSHHCALQYILGIRPEIEGLRIDPCIPKSWEGFEAERKFRGSTVKIKVKNPLRLSKGVFSLLVDGQKIVGNLLPVDFLRDGVEVEAVIGLPGVPVPVLDNLEPTCETAMFKHDVGP